MDIYSSDSLHFVFTQVMRTHYHKMYTLLRDKEVYPGQPPLLSALTQKDGQSQKELAAKLKNSAATITVMLNRMEKAGLVERRRDEKDQRMTRVFLTERGREAHKNVREALSLLEKQCFDNVTAEEQRLLHKLFLQMYENLIQDMDQDAVLLRKEDKP